MPHGGVMDSVVDVTAFGMITSVGWDAPIACASLRAGLTRPAPVSEFEVIDESEMTMVPVTGHPITGYTDGFVMVGRWHRLVDGAIESLWKTQPLPPPTDAAFWGNTALVAITPPLVNPRFGTEDDEPVDIEFAAIAAERLFSGALLPSNVHHFDEGRTGVIRAIAEAERWLQSGQVDRVLVVAVDSYLDPITLEQLAVDQRLKCDESPSGLSPGEAGACLLLESANAAAQRDAPVLMSCRGIGMGEDVALRDEGQNLGRGLAHAVRACLAKSQGSRPFKGDVISDHNGENWRAAELGGAQVLLASEWAADATSIWIPATSIGEVGAASTAAALCFAGHLFARGCARGSETLVLSSTELGRCAAALVAAG